MKVSRDLAIDGALLLGVAGALLLAFLVCLPSYNSPKDEFADLYCGERYWAYIRTHDPIHLDFTKLTLGFYTTPEHPSNHPNWFVPHEPGLYSRHLLPLVLSAACCELFSRVLPVFANPLHAHRFVNYFQVLALAVVFYLVLRRRLGRPLTMFALLAFLLHPRIVSEMFNNVKDVAILAQYSIAVLLFLHAVDRPGRAPWWLVLMIGASVGIAAATKVNGLILPFLFLAALVALFVIRKLRRLPALQSFGPTRFAAMLLTAVPVYFAVNPFFWHDLRNRLFLYKEFINDYMFARAYTPDSWFRPIEFFATFPDVLLAIVCAGIVMGFRRALRGEVLAVIVFGWLATPLVRVSLPSAVNTDGIRHFIDAVPAAMILATYGLRLLMRAATWLGASAPAARVGVAALAAGALVHEGVAVARVHPYQSAYFDQLAGGLAGARASGHYTMPGDYWANCYLDVLPWLNGHAPKGTAVIVPAMIGGARPHAGDLLVTEDIPLYRRGGKVRDPQIAELAQDGKLFLVILEEPYYFQAGRRVYLSWRDGLTPCYDVRLGGATLATVYRISPADLDRLEGVIRSTIAAIEKDFRSQPQLKLAFGLQQLYGQLGLELPPDLKRVMIEQLKRGRDQALFFNERDTADRILKRLESSPDARPEGEGPP